jgi:S1-C subfamily serine protease
MKQIFAGDGVIVRDSKEERGRAYPDGGPAPDTRKKRFSLMQLMATVLSCALLATVVGLVVTRDRAASSVTSRSAALHQDTRPVSPSSTVRMIKRVLPSVVNIRTTAVGFSSFGGTDKVRAEGSGVVVKRDGIILTNDHVIAGALKVNVLFNDGEHHALRGTVVGADPEHDLAVVRVSADDLRPISLGDSNELELGESVVAVGFPLGLGGPTVTKGIVSGLDRTIQAQGETTGVERLGGIIQTDAAINPGNSGGALLDADGRLIGINTAAASAASAENVGFAIPVDEAVPTVQRLLTETPQHQPWLGVQASSLTSDLEALQLGLPSDTRGALIVGTLPGSPADSAGLRPGDVIVQLDHDAIASSPALTKTISKLAPGDAIELLVRTSQGSRTVHVRLGTRPPTFAAPQG